MPHKLSPKKLPYLNAVYCNMTSHTNNFDHFNCLQDTITVRHIKVIKYNNTKKNLHIQKNVYW